MRELIRQAFGEEMNSITIALFVVAVAICIIAYCDRTLK